MSQLGSLSNFVRDLGNGLLAIGFMETRSGRLVGLYGDEDGERPPRPQSPPPPAPQFEQEELSSVSSAASTPVSSQEAELREGCRWMEAKMNDLLDCDNSLGEGLMSFMDDAETISRQKSCEGYYLAACQKLKRISEVRGSLVGVAKEIIQHHNQTTGSQYVLDQKRQYESELQRRQVSQDALNASRLARIRSLENELVTQRRSFDEELRAARNISQEKEYEIMRLRSSLVREGCVAKTFRRLVKRLNRRIYEITKAARKGCPPPLSPTTKTDVCSSKCHILGTYDDMIGLPV
jgi:hypothetical protein